MSNQTLYDKNWIIWTTQRTQLACEIREKSVRPFSSK